MHSSNRKTSINKIWINCLRLDMKNVHFSRKFGIKWAFSWAETPRSCHKFQPNPWEQIFHGHFQVSGSKNGILHGFWGYRLLEVIYKCLIIQGTKPLVPGNYLLAREVIHMCIVFWKTPQQN